LETGPEMFWLAQSDGTTSEGNARAPEMQKLLEVQLRRIGVDCPAGQFTTLDQVNRVNSLFNLKEDETSTRDVARVILGMWHIRPWVGRPGTALVTLWRANRRGSSIGPKLRARPHRQMGAASGLNRRAT